MFSKTEFAIVSNISRTNFMLSWVLGCGDGIVCLVTEGGGWGGSTIYWLTVGQGLLSL